MSLKNFHLLFITAAVLLALLSAVVAFDRLRTGGGLMPALGIAVSLFGAAGLVRYEQQFLRRCREQGIR